MIPRSPGIILPALLPAKKAPGRYNRLAVLYHIAQINRMIFDKGLKPVSHNGCHVALHGDTLSFYEHRNACNQP